MIYSEPNFREDKLSYQVGEAADLIGVSRATLYNAHRRGDLVMGKLYGRTLIPAPSLKEFWRKNFKPLKPAA